MALAETTSKPEFGKPNLHIVSIRAPVRARRLLHKSLNPTVKSRHLRETRFKPLSTVPCTISKLSKNQRSWLYNRRESLPKSVSAIGSRDKQFALDDEWTVRIERWLGTMMLNAMIPVVTEKVNSQTIGRGIDDLQEPRANSD